MEAHVPTETALVETSGLLSCKYHANCKVPEWLHSDVTICFRQMSGFMAMTLLTLQNAITQTKASKLCQLVHNCASHVY